MPEKAVWVMSESDTFEFLNATDERLATACRDQQQHDMLVRLRSLLEDDLDALGSRQMMQSLDAGPDSTTQPT